MDTISAAIFERPILFNTQMVRQIEKGAKTQTRRIINPRLRAGEAGFSVCRNESSDRWIETYDEDERLTGRIIQRPFAPGDLLYVRETWNYGFVDSDYRECAPSEAFFQEEEPGKRGKFSPPGLRWWYRADEDDEQAMAQMRGFWKPSIHMPKEAARIWLLVKKVRIERLQEISTADIDAEGCKEWAYDARTGELLPSKPTWFKILWDECVPSGQIDRFGWEANPWVWVFDFEKAEAPRQ